MHGRRLARTLTTVAQLACLTIALVVPAALPALANPTESITKWQCQQKICQRVSQRGSYLTIEMRNDHAVATWVVLEPRGLANVRPLQATPFIVRLEPREVKTAGLLGIQDPDAPHRYRTKWRVLPGNPQAVHDDRWHYRMPFGGSGYIPISQGYNGKFSHKGLDAYSLDFPMPWGTPILASRGGTIVEVINDKVASGIRTGESEGDNRVIIEHVDGTFAVYAHLRHGGPARLGQRVKSGELIGLSGDTGFSTGPHLHFEVYKVRGDGRRQSIPVRFWNGTKAGFTPLAGLQFKPGCPRDGGEVCMPGELASELSTKRPGGAAPASRTADTGTPARSMPAAPAAPDPAAKSGSAPKPRRRADGACVCPNRAVLHVDLPCELVCGR